MKSEVLTVIKAKERTYTREITALFKKYEITQSDSSRIHALANMIHSLRRKIKNNKDENTINR